MAARGESPLRAAEFQCGHVSPDQRLADELMAVAEMAALHEMQAHGGHMGIRRRHIEPGHTVGGIVKVHRIGGAEGDGAVAAGHHADV